MLLAQKICLLQEDENSDSDVENDPFESDAENEEEVISTDIGVTEAEAQPAAESDASDSDAPSDGTEEADEPAAYVSQTQEPGVCRTKTGRE